MSEEVKIPMSIFNIRIRRAPDGAYTLPRENATAEAFMDHNCIRVPGKRLTWYPKLEACFDIMQLKDYYKGKIIYIVGKGPSLDLVVDADFEPGCPVICINESVEIINRLSIDNPLYLVQADTGLTINPGRAELMLNINIRNLYPEYESRFLWRSEQFGYGVSARLSVEMAIKIAILMGCPTAHMMAFDATVSGDVSYAGSIGHEPKLAGQEEFPGQRFLKHKKNIERAAGTDIELVFIQASPDSEETSDIPEPSSDSPA